MKSTQLSLLDLQAIEQVKKTVVIHFQVKLLGKDTQRMTGYILSETPQVKIVNRVFKDRFGQLFVGVQSVNRKSQAAENSAALYEVHQTVQDYLKTSCEPFVSVMKKRESEFYAN
ncbi:hypothetical protein [Leuconostoc gasicomitatum]|uniref:hypothetical protein n=1 Tax=Leuconostoc gasicomitatum TaxID=115778 RepID=UPI0007DFFB0D|nr:hypothetical protein [Leuconostoc gasicomitatum]CUW05997.1 hypothetical protein PB1E_1533 [Leuconostoc gasicomitatum]